MDVIGQNALERKYRFGYSFKNPKMVKTSYRPKYDPWFKMQWAAYGPTQVKRDIWNQSKLPEYPSVWRRAGKHVNLKKLGVGNQSEMYDFNELGQAPSATSRAGATEGRSIWGFLENVATKVTDIVMAREQMKLAQAQAELQERAKVINPESGFSYLPWILGVGMLGAGAYFVSRR